MVETSDGVHVSAAELIQMRLHAGKVTLREKRSTAVMVGGRQSRFRGRGVDFQESRIYQPGDDIRSMDWRVTARTGKPHTKIYEEERERPVILLLDFNASMFFGTRVAFKSVIAARLAALLAWVAVKQGDRIGALCFAASEHQELVPTAGRGGALHLIRALVDWTNRGANERKVGAASEDSFGHALQRLRRVARPGSLVVMLSDFYAFNDTADTANTSNSQAERHLSRLREHNDIIACRIVDPLELAPPPPGRYGVTDGVQQRILDTGSAAQREHYAAFFANHQRRLSERLQRRSIPLLSISTQDDLVAALRQQLATAAPRIGSSKAA